MRGTIPSTIAILPLPGASAAAVAWRWRGQLWITVIAKATFAFAEDAEMPRVDPEPILATEVHHGQNPGRSIRSAGDLAPHLARADVLFTGSAHAPDGGANQLYARLAVFAGERPLLDKRLLVQDPAGFTKIPLVFERARRGPTGAENPFGVASNANVVDPADPERVAGFGPIARVWPARKRLLGALPRKRLEGAVAEIPDDFDWSYYQAAPPDQQTDLLRGGEWIVLEGLSPAGLARMRLPDARGVARLHGLSAFGVAEGQPLELTADTLSIDGDERRCAVVWRKSFAVPSDAALSAARIAAGVELPGDELTWPEARALDELAFRGGAGAASSGTTETMALSPSTSVDDPETIAILPFAASSPSPAVPFRAGAPSAEVAAPSARLPVDESPETGTFMLDPAAPLAAGVLPFDRSALAPAGHREALPFDSSPAPLPPPRRLPVEHVDTGTLALMGPRHEAPIAAPALLPVSAPILDPAPIVDPTPIPAPVPVAAPAPVAALPAEPPASPWAPAPAPAPPRAPPPAPKRPTPPGPSPELKQSLYSAFNRKG